MPIKFLEDYLGNLTKRVRFREGKTGVFDPSVEKEFVRLGIAEFTTIEMKPKPVVLISGTTVETSQAPTKTKTKPKQKPETKPIVAAKPKVQPATKGKSKK